MKGVFLRGKLFGNHHYHHHPNQFAVSWVGAISLSGQIKVIINADISFFIPGVAIGEVIFKGEEIRKSLSCTYL